MAAATMSRNLGMSKTKGVGMGAAVTSSMLIL